jgi:hypothetical protein
MLRFIFYIFAVAAEEGDQSVSETESAILDTLSS